MNGEKGLCSYIFTVLHKNQNKAPIQIGSEEENEKGDPEEGPLRKFPKKLEQKKIEDSLS